MSEEQIKSDEIFARRLQFREIRSFGVSRPSSRSTDNHPPLRIIHNHQRNVASNLASDILLFLDHLSPQPMNRNHTLSVNTHRSPVVASNASEILGSYIIPPPSQPDESEHLAASIRETFQFSESHNTDFLPIISSLNHMTNFFNILEESLSSVGENPTLDNNVPVTMRMDDIEKLESKKMKDIINPNKLTTCVICLSKFKDNDDIRLLKCKHNFHTECIDKWLKDYNYKCPICREETGKGYPVL